MSDPRAAAHDPERDVECAGAGPARAFVVVPDGLAADSEGRALGEPSFVFAWVLDRVSEFATPRDAVYLAPANRFGGPLSEQEAALQYLRARGVANLVCCREESSGYIDTRGNARLLRRALERTGDWPLPRATLVAYHLHAPRASMLFRREGFELADVVAVKPRRFTRDRIVGRLWYYRYPLLHRAYEAAARVLYRASPAPMLEEPPTPGERPED